MYLSEDDVKSLRAEAASRAINRTIRMVGEELDISFPTVGTPSENRELMIAILREHIGSGGLN